MRIVVELTDRCNLRCLHCFRGRYGGRGELPLAVLERLLDQGRQSGIGEIDYTGGEPTLHRQFDEIIRLTSAAGFDYGVVTNGWTFAERHGVFLAYREHLKVITFSIDGASAHTHDAQRGPDSFHRLMQAASVCVAKGIPFTYNFTVTAINLAEVEPAIELARSLGSQGIRLTPVMMDGQPHAEQVVLELAAINALEDRLREAQQRYDFPVALGASVRSDDLFPCASLRGRELNLDWRGQLGLCCNLSGHQPASPGLGPLVTLEDGNMDAAVAHIDGRRIDFRDDKARRAEGGLLGSADYHPCDYCFRRWREHPFRAQATASKLLSLAGRSQME